MFKRIAITLRLLTVVAALLLATPLQSGVLNTVVTDYGAKGDGVTDDSNAIQSAINDTLPGGTVFFPAGTYMLGTAHGPPVMYSPAQVAQTGVASESYALDVPVGLMLRGEGRHSILELMPVRLGILQLRGAGSLVEKLVFDGNASARYLRDPATGFSFDWPHGNIVSGIIYGRNPQQGPIVRDCELRNALEDGVGVLPGPGFTVESCYIHDNGAFHVDGSSHGGGAGISMNGGPNNSALHNILMRNTHGLGMGFRPQNHSVEDNAVIGNCFSGIFVGSGSSNDDGVEGSGFLIADDLFERNGGCGGLAFYVVGEESGTFVDNFVLNNAGDAAIAFLPSPFPGKINLNWALTRNLIGNTAPDRPQRVGVYIEATSEGIDLTGNTIFNNGTQLSNQLTIQSMASVNPDWQTANTITYSPPGPIPPAPVVATVVHAATRQAGPVAPGEIVAIQGQGLGPPGAVAGQATSYGRLQKSVANVRALFDGVPAPLLSVSATEVTAIVPYFTYWKDTTNLQLEYQGVQSVPMTLSLVDANPGIFPQSVLNADGSANSSSNLADRGSVVIFLASGEGQTDPAGVDGQVSGTDNLPTPRGAVAVSIGGQSAQVISAVEAPLSPAGKLWVALVVPASVPAGTALPIVLTVGTSQSPAGSAELFVSSGPAISSNYQGLWWASPAGSESGWGLNVAHQGDTIFATWFTYDTAGKEWWLSMTANKTASNPDTYSGQLIETHGPTFSTVPFDPGQVTRTVVGTGTLTFTDANNGAFAYSVTTASGAQAEALTQQNKPITRQVFGTLPTCTYAAQANPAVTTNFTDLWWAAPAGAEAGWGINLTHEGSNIFTTWFTYDTDGTPLWLSSTLAQGVGQSFSGDLIQTAGPAFSSVPFDPNQVTRTNVGNATLTFADGNTGSFDYTAKGVTQHKAITRQIFNPPAGTVCF